MNEWVDVWEGWKDRWMDGWTDAWMDGRMHGWMDGWMDGWMEAKFRLNEILQERKFAHAKFREHEISLIQIMVQTD